MTENNGAKVVRCSVLDEGSAELPQRAPRGNPREPDGELASLVFLVYLSPLGLPEGSPGSPRGANGMESQPRGVHSTDNYFNLRSAAFEWRPPKVKRR